MNLSLVSLKLSRRVWTHLFVITSCHILVQAFPWLCFQNKASASASIVWSQPRVLPLGPCAIGFPLSSDRGNWSHTYYASFSLVLVPWRLSFPRPLCPLSKSSSPSLLPQHLPIKFKMSPSGSHSNLRVLKGAPNQLSWNSTEWVQSWWIKEVSKMFSVCGTWLA